MSNVRSFKVVADVEERIFDVQFISFVCYGCAVIGSVVFELPPTDFSNFSLIIYKSRIATRVQSKPNDGSQGLNYT